MEVVVSLTQAFDLLNMYFVVFLFFMGKLCRLFVCRVLSVLFDCLGMFVYW